MGVWGRQIGHRFVGGLGKKADGMPYFIGVPHWNRCSKDSIIFRYHINSTFGRLYDTKGISLAYKSPVND
jgi:hypothetical protein